MGCTRVLFLCNGQVPRPLSPPQLFCYPHKRSTQDIHLPPLSNQLQSTHTLQIRPHTPPGAAILATKKQNTPPDTVDKLTHAGHIKALQTIITETTPPRVETTPPPRVSGSTAPNPITTPTSNDPTAQRVIRATKQVHQQRTGSNPMPTII